MSEFSGQKLTWVDWPLLAQSGHSRRNSHVMLSAKRFHCPGGPCSTSFASDSANWAGDPIVAEKRPDYYAINYPELQARIEIAHRPLIEVNDAARR